MNPPKLPAPLAWQLEPHRRRLRRLIESIKADPGNRAIWRRAQAASDRLVEIEKEFFSEGRPAA